MSKIFNVQPSVRILSCPACGETMNTSQQKCPKCGLAVDLNAAEEAANSLSVINQACSDATMVDAIGGLSLAVGIVGLFVLFRFRRVGYVFITFESLASSHSLANIYALSLLVAVGMLAALGAALRWSAKYSRLQTPDQEFAAKKSGVKTSATRALSFLILEAAVSIYLWIS